MSSGLLNVEGFTASPLARQFKSTKLRSTRASAVLLLMAILQRRHQQAIYLRLPKVNECYRDLSPIICASALFNRSGFLSRIGFTYPYRDFISKFEQLMINP